mgnify:CR=1 FL=1
MQRNTLIKILTFFIMTTIVGTVLYFGLVRKAQPVVQQPRYNVPQTEIASLPTPTSTRTDETASWTMYRNEEYGIEFRHPVDWRTHISHDESGYLVQAFSPELYEIAIEGGDPDIPTDKFAIRILFGGVHDKTLDGKNITFAGKKALDTGWKTNTLNEMSLRIVEMLPDPLVRIEMNSISSDSQRIEDQMLSTFKFIRRANTSTQSTVAWSVYRNTKYNYSFRYPKDFTIFVVDDKTVSKHEVIPPTATSDEVLLTDDRRMLFCCEPIVTSVTVVPGFIDIKNWRKYALIPKHFIQSKGEMMFVGRKAFEVRSAFAPFESEPVRLIVIPGDKFSFVIKQGGEGELWESITNSFRFE